MKQVCLLFAGGGTGGHVFPLLAVADAVRALAEDVRIVFVGTNKGLETKVVAERGYELELLEVVPMRGGGLHQLARGAASAAFSLPKARLVVTRHAPHALFSLGGYAAGPLSLMARAKGIPVALMEPNTVAGLANRMIAPFVQRAYTAFDESSRYFKASRLLKSGVPIRCGFARREYSVPASELRVLVLGGSQGAQSLNRAVPEALARLPAELSIEHQSGPAHEAELVERYRRLGFGDRARVTPFIDDVALALERAHLVIARAGASTLAEICAVGRPSLLVPYPYAADDHQRHNAQALERAGAAVCLSNADATALRIFEALQELSPDRLERMAAAAATLGRPEAAKTIACDLLELAGLSSSENAVSHPREICSSGSLSEKPLLRWSVPELQGSATSGSA